MLDLLEAMGAQYKEKHDALLAMPWKLFCAKWGRLYRTAYRQEMDKRRRERKQQDARDWAALEEAANRRGMGGGGL